MLSSARSSAVILAAWTFEPQPFVDSVGANVSTGPSVTASSGVFAGVSTANGFHASTATDWTTPAGNVSTDSYGVNTFAVGDYFQFATASTGYTGITISFDQTGSSTGPRDFKVQYSIDGTTFTDLAGGSYVVLVNGFGGASTNWGTSTGSASYGFTFDLSSISALDNDGSIFFRLTNTSIVSIAGGTVGTGGSSRIDNFVVNGVPEPTSAFLGALGLLGILRRRR